MGNDEEEDRLESLRMYAAEASQSEILVNQNAVPKLEGKAPQRSGGQKKVSLAVEC